MEEMPNFVYITRRKNEKNEELTKKDKKDKKRKFKNI